MSENIIDYTYEQTQKLVKKNNEKDYYAFDRKSYNFFYNVPNGNFNKKYQFQTNGEDVLFNISAFLTGSASVTVKFNGNVIFNGTFSNFIFVNDCLSTLYFNNLEITITPENCSISKLNVNFDGEMYIDSDKKCFAKNGSTVKMLCGDIIEFSSLNDLKNGINDYKSPSQYSIFDIMYKCKTDGQLGDFMVLYDKNGMLTIKNTNSNVEYEIVDGVESACFIKTNFAVYELLYVKNGKLYKAVVGSNMDSVETNLLTQFESVTEVSSAVSDGVTGKVVIVSENNIYVMDFYLTDASLINNNITAIGDGNSAMAFYDSNTMYVFSSNYNELKLYTFDCTSAPVKKSESVYKNFVGGFVYDGKVYVYGKNSVLLVSEDE